ncbi:MAG: hypothetical protein J0L52_05575 [Caulobacterales bacterium]|nr:hypothetical protein [Caulobacterales bacterium]
MKLISLTAAAVLMTATATAAQAQIRVCETTLRGPAGEHQIYIEMDGDRMVFGEAVWAPPRQNARANIEFPRIELNYGIRDLETGARSPLRYVTVIHAVRMTNTRSTSAEVTLAPYRQAGEQRDWPFFARARDGGNTRLRNSSVIAGTIHFTSADALEMALTAPQLETSVVTNLGENLANGVFLMTHRPALDALFDHVFQQTRNKARNPGRECRGLRHDEESRFSRSEDLRSSSVTDQDRR